MDEYRKLANDYYRRFEGLQLYPDARNVIFWLWLGSLVAWIASFPVAVSHGLRPTGLFSTSSLIFWLEALFVATSLGVVNFKRKRLIGNRKRIAGAPLTIEDQLREEALTAACGVSRTKFLAVAKECADLVAMNKSQRLPSELGLSYFALKIYDPDSKARLTSICLAAIAVFVALVARSLPPDSPSLLEILAEDSLWPFVYTLAGMSAAAFIIWIGFQAMVLVVWTNLTHWWVRLFSDTNDSVAVRYFIRDLVRLHQPNEVIPKVDVQTHPVG